ncbi:MAG: molybdopterin molybdenumtransferase MoeA [Caulobacterales bacterium 32-69-10]|nr:MAG: molybdopterin molybdenumtransferase MoeA [Caulobacterales bacterium 32-69-10]
MKNLAVEEARARMLAQVTPLGTEPVAVGAAAMGRVLAQTVRALRDQPPFEASAMDGWAVRRADAEAAAASLRIAGESAAGHGHDAALQPGEAVRIFTGGVVPPGADMVVIQEEAARDGDRVVVGPLAGKSAHIRPRGGDFHAGDVLLEPGARLDPWRISLAAAAGASSLAVARRPRLLLLTTGEELVAAGTEPGPHQIFNSGGPSLSSLAAQWGAEVVRIATAGDSEDKILAAVDGVACDLIVTVGGASVGDHDLVKPALARLGLELMVETVRLRPGKPTWFGTLGDGRKVLGLPGNPASAFVCAELFLQPLLATWQGASPDRPILYARLEQPLGPTGPREHWMRAAVTSRPDGTFTARPFSDQDSSLVGVFARADALMRRPADAPAAAVGDVVEVMRLERL